VGYYMAGNVQNQTMYRVGPSHVDMKKTWDLIECLLKRDQVVRVFMDKAIQTGMRRYLQKKGLASEELLKRLFEVKSDDPGSALVRHAPKHDTHIHVRFACDPADGTCREERGDTVFALKGESPGS
jgi:murein endopeptidase